MPQPKLEDFDPGLVALAGFGKALSHPARIAILRLLAGGREAASMDIVDALPLSQPACSRHLAELVKAGLIRSRSAGSRVFYRLEPKAVASFCSAMSTTLHP
jgi:ArsR family transcriptional regulator